MSDIEKYGCKWDVGDPAAIELACIRQNGRWKVGDKSCGMGLAYHVKALAKIALPWFYWHRWNELVLEQLCSDARRITIFGAASSQKTSTASLYAWAIYSALPRGTTVLVSTTTREMLDMRIWGEIKMIWRKARERVPWLPGVLTDSKQTLTTDGKDVEGREFRDGVVGRPVKKGGAWVGLGDFVGIKNDRVIVIADEYHLMPDAIGRSLSNLAANDGCKFIALGNLGDLTTPLGEEAEPEHGWDSIADSNSARVYKTKWFGGKAIQLPGEDSPNLDFPEDQEPYKKLIGRRFLAECEQNYGKGTPLYNMMAGGMIPRGTLELRVLTKQVCMQFNAFDPVTWGSDEVTKLYCADISYTFEHGDKSVGIPLGFCRDTEGKLRIALLDRPKVFDPTDRAEGTQEDQLAGLVKLECERLGIPPSHFFFDGTGRSSFTAACMRLWSTSVNPVEFGGKATERANFMGRKRQDGTDKGELFKCSEVFEKFVSELWFALRYAVEADQIRGLTEDIVREASLRLYRIIKGNRMELEPKKDMKVRLGRSPDSTDALVTGLEGARRLGFPLGKLAGDKPRNKELSKWLREQTKRMEALRQSRQLNAS